MDDYISRKAACNALDSEGYTKNMRVHKKILAIPATDVVEVVRCRECKHYDCEDGDQKCVKDAEWSEEDMCYYGFISYHGPEFFCADGERKGGGQEPPEEVLSGTKR